MKVKSFHIISTVPAGRSSSDTDFTDIDKDINKFLSDNPNIKVVDIKLTAFAAPVGEHVTNYNIHAMLIYETE